MQNIYLIRHGQSKGNVDRTVYQTVADHALPLSDLGWRQAKAAGEAMLSELQRLEGQPVRIWCSPYRRTRETADALQSVFQSQIPQLDRREHINLCEQQFGLFDGLEPEELDERFPTESAHYKRTLNHEGKFWARMPLGESRFDVAVRIHEAFGTFHRDAARDGVRNIVVVCHGVTLRAFVMQWLHLPYEWFDQQPNPNNCDIYHIPAKTFKEGGYIYRTPPELQ